MTFNFKKEQKQFYLPGDKPEIIDIPPMNFIAISGKGDPHEEDGTYKQAVKLLHTIAYTIRMSYRGEYSIEGFFKYVVPPLEGFWWTADIKGIDYSSKKDLHWISMIRLPDFVKKTNIDWAKAQAARKKQKDFSKVMFIHHTEGLCIQCMHKGPHENGQNTIRQIEKYAENNGYLIDITSSRLHHEIYLKDPRKCTGKKLRTVIRQPVKKRG